MAQNFDLLLSTQHYTRTDFTALRAWLNKLTLNQISSLYYTDEDLEALGCQTESLLQARLEELRDRLIQRAMDNNPHLAELLRNARRSSAWSSKLVDYLVHAADAQLDQPKKTDTLSAWFRPRVAQVFRSEGVKTLAELMDLIHVRGFGWWKPIRRIGAGKAAIIETWLGKYHSTLGPLSVAEREKPAGSCIVIHPGDTTLVPIERILLPEALDGRHGRNRNQQFCLISARHDHDAIDAYLYKFRDQEKTRRAYQKEIERFLLWCITVRGIPMSSVLHEDCEAYKDFISSVPQSWIGLKTTRSNPAWRPFAGQIATSSQRYAIQAIRFFFNWLVDVRYLAGNPWATVADPRVSTRILPLHIDKALPNTLWEKLISPAGILDKLCDTADDILQKRYRLRGAAAKLSLSAQFRLVRATLLLIGDTGIRREEAAYATRDKLKPIADSQDIWELDVLGKRNKWRTVFPSRRVIRALDAHWHDRGQDFTFGLTDRPLISPLMSLRTKSGQVKHGQGEQNLPEQGFSVDGLYQLVKTALKRIAEDNSFDLEPWEREHLKKAAPHAFRHTFGTQAVAKDVPLDVVQKVLGHASLQTTTIYVQAEKKRSIDELGKLFRSSQT